MRRSGRTQTKSLVPPQRIDFGQGKRRSSGGMRSAISAAAGIAAAVFSQHPIVAFLAQLLAARAMLAQEAGERLLRRVDARAALGRAAGGDARRHLGRQRDAARAMRTSAHRRGVSGASASTHSRAQVLRCAGLHARRDFLAEQFEEQFRHRQSFSAGSMSVLREVIALE